MTYSGKKQSVPSSNPPPLKPKKLRLLLKLAIGAASLLVLLIILFLSVNLNTFRGPITEALSQATGLKIKIEFLDWGFSEGLKFKCKGVQIFSGETDEELVSTKDLLISLNWLPLLEQRVVINSITLVEAVLKIPIRPSSQNSALPLSEKSNSDITPTPSIGKEPPSPNWIHDVREFLKQPNLTLTEINLIAGQVILQDKETGKETLLNAGARMRINREGSRVGLVLDDIELGMGNIRVWAEIRSDDLLAPNGLVQANIQIDPFKVSDLLPVFEWAPDARRTINEKLRLKGNFRKLNFKVETPVDTLTDFDSFVHSAKAELDLEAQEVSLTQFGKTLSVPRLETAIQWRDQQWAHKIVLSVLGGNFETEGKIFRKKGSVSALDWTLDSHMTLERINMRELKNIFLNQVSWFPDKGILTGKVHVQGPVLRPEAMKSKGQLKVLNLEVKIKDTAVPIPVTEFEGTWSNNRLLHDLKLKIFGGNLQVKGHLKMNKTRLGGLDPVIDSEVTPQSIRLADLKPLIQKDWFPKQGTLSAKVHVQGPVLRPEAMKGKGQLKVLNLKIRVKDTPVPIPVTEFEGTWANNRLTHDLKLNVFGGNIQVKGRLDLAKDRQGNRDPVINSKVFVKPVLLTRIKPLVAQNWFPDKGTLTSEVHVQGPVLRPEAIKAQGKLRVRNTAIQLEGSTIYLEDIEGKGVWSDHYLSHHITIKAFGGSVAIQGNLNFKKNNQGELDPVIDSEVTPQSIRLADLKPLIQKDWFPKQGTLSAKVHVQGPVLRPEAMKGKGNLKVLNLKIRVKDIPVPIPVTEFEGVWANNQLLHDLKIGPSPRPCSGRSDMSISGSSGMAYSSFERSASSSSPPEKSESGSVRALSSIGVDLGVPAVEGVLISS